MRHIRFKTAASLLTVALLPLVSTMPASAQTGTAPLKACTPKTSTGVPCAPFFGGALRIGDPAVTDTLIGAPCNTAGCGASTGEVTNYSATGDGNIWIFTFSYTPGDPISDTAVGVLIYDDQWNVKYLQFPTMNPPHTLWFPFESKAGTVYQVQVFNYTPNVITYTIGVKKAP